MNEKARKIKSLIVGAIVGLLTIPIVLMLQIIIPLILSLILNPSNSGISLIYILCVILGLIILGLLNIGNERRSWMRGFVLGIATILVSGFLFFWTCLFSFSGFFVNGNVPWLMLVIVPIPIIILVVLLAISIKRIVKEQDYSTLEPKEQENQQNS